MDTPICVTDAQTLVDNIHEIKKWIYHGNLRLVVSLDTSEAVSRLYEKSIEPKQTIQEPPRPKSAGRAAKKEYPLFDINPKIAQEYLSRIRAGKEGRPVAKDRPLYEETEVQDALEFQNPSEEYTPWKDAPLMEDKVEVQEARPTSWADAAKKKSTSTNGMNDRALAQKGPVKPKLVSKTTGQDSSPWKVQRNAPKVSPAEVPRPLRPLLSHALWRIHESVHRNDRNQLFLMTDNEHLRNLAVKLNIVVLSAREVRFKVDSQLQKVDLNVFGDLEKDGFARAENPGRDAANLRGGHPSELSSTELAESAGSAHGKIEPTGQNALGASDPAAKSVEDLLGNHKVNGNAAVDLEQPIASFDESSHEQAHSRSIEEDVAARPTDKPPVVIDPRDLVRDLLNPQFAGMNQTPANGPQKPLTVVLDQPAPPTASDLTQGVQPPPLTGIEKPTSQPTIQSLQDQVKPGDKKEEEADDNDSDEEVVVFVPNPKRMSSQKKPTQPDSRPPTSNGDTPAKTDKTVHVPPKSTSNGKGPQPELKPAFQPHRHSKTAKQSSGGKPRPNSSGPTIIDPDAFGRNFAVNPDSSPRENHRRPRSSHSPQTSFNHGYAATSLTRNSPQPQPRSSPQRQTPGRSPRRSPRRSPKGSTLANEEAQIPSSTIPTINHQDYSRATLVAPSAQKNKQSQFGPIAPPSKARKETSVTPAKDADTGSPPPQVQVVPNRDAQHPKSARGAGQPTGHHKHRPSSPRSAPSNGHSNSSHQHQNKRPIKPTLFEPSIDHTRAQPGAEPHITQPDSKFPDVQYILKSGATREASRGKGKLWVG